MSRVRTLDMAERDRWCRLRSSHEWELVTRLDLAQELVRGGGGALHRVRERRAELAEGAFQVDRRCSDGVEVRRRRDARRRADHVLERERGLLRLLDPLRPLREPQLRELRAELLEVAAAGDLARELAQNDDRRRLANGVAPLERTAVVVQRKPLA